MRQFANAYRNSDLAVLEGLHPATHALRFGAQLEIAVTYDREKLFKIANRVAPDVVSPIDEVLHVVDQSLFGKLSPWKLSSPLISIAPRPHSDLSGAFARRGKPIIYLERPRDPGNVGAVIRVAAAADIEAVIVSGLVDPWSPVVIRSGTGLQFGIDVGSAELPLDTGRPIVTIDADGEPLQSSNLDVNSILVVGGERYGLSPRIREMAHQSVAVPMKVGVSSLNLSTAISAVLFSWKASVMERTGSYLW
jgi:RNA methyltransferase, TrmH family